MFFFFFSFSISNIGRKTQVRKWAQPYMNDAYQAVKSGGKMSINATAKKFPVPRMTVSDRTRGKVRLSINMGVQTALTTEEESTLVHYIDDT